MTLLSDDMIVYVESPKEFTKQVLELICGFGKITNTRATKDLHDPDNHDDVITHLEPDNWEREVKQALESITTNKASGGKGKLINRDLVLRDTCQVRSHTSFHFMFARTQTGIHYYLRVRGNVQRKLAT